MNHLLNIVKKKEKDVTKLFRMKERPNMNFWPMYYVLCKEFEKLFCMNLIMSLNSMKTLETL